MQPCLTFQPCSVCHRLQPPGWQFRADDVFCGLCGKQVLHTISDQSSPGPGQRTVCLYWGPDREVHLDLFSVRGLPDQPRRLLLRPTLDLQRSHAHFRGDIAGDVFFRLEPLDTNGRPEAVSVRLVPERELTPDFMRMLPQRGLTGHLSLAFGTGVERWPAVLFPWPDPLFSCRTVEPSHAPQGNVYPVYQQGKDVTIPLELCAGTPLWILSCIPAEGGSPDISLDGFSQPVLVEPGKPYRFALRMDSSQWAPNTPVAFRFQWKLLTLGPEQFEGYVTLAECAKLEFGGNNLRVLPEVPLGHVVNDGVPMTVSGPYEAVERGLEIVRYDVFCDEPAGNWLHVDSPPPDNMRVRVYRDSPDRVAEELRFRVDTTKFDREGFQPGMLRGRIELHDEYQRRWTLRIHVPVRTPEELAHAVGFDWGTTNSCAAFCTSRDDEAPQPVFFRPGQTNPELFPSDLYFEDLSDPNDPRFLMGFEAVNRARTHHPECCLHSVKRKFQKDDPLFVMDERGRCHTYTTEQIATLVLRKLILLAEQVQRREVVELGVTYPTKWPPRVRQKLARVAESLQARLRSERRSTRITVRPPEIDEANAVAINLITSDHGRHLPNPFFLIAYDFGGGTVDTTVLEVRFEKGGFTTRYIGIGGRGDFGGDDVTRAVMLLLHEKLQHVLNRHDIFLTPGGGERVQVRLESIPLVTDGTSLDSGGRPGAATRHKDGRQNWDALWDVAEKIKMDLCGGPPVEGSPVRKTHLEQPPPMAEIIDTSGPAKTDLSLPLDEELTETPEDPMTLEMDGTPTMTADFGAAIFHSSDDTVANPVRDRLQTAMASIQCYLRSDRGAVRESLDRVFEALERAIGAGIDHVYQELRLTLEEICDYPLEDVLGTTGGRRFRVRERVEDTIRELRQQCNDAGIEPHIIVLAGGGCRLPLIDRMMREHFPASDGQEKLYYQPETAKRRVAHGMARYLSLKDRPRLFRGLARSLDVLFRHLLLREDSEVNMRLVTQFRPIARAGTPMNDPATWHSPFTFHADQVETDAADGPAPPHTGPLPPVQGAGSDDGRRLPVWTSDWREGPRAFGYFDLGRPLGGDGCVAAPLPLGHEEYTGQLRLRGAGQIEIKVKVGDEEYGPYPLVATVAEPESVLQS